MSALLLIILPQYIKNSRQQYICLPIVYYEFTGNKKHYENAMLYIFSTADNMLCNSILLCKCILKSFKFELIVLSFSILNVFNFSLYLHEFAFDMGFPIDIFLWECVLSLKPIAFRHNKNIYISLWNELQKNLGIPHYFYVKTYLEHTNIIYPIVPQFQ